MLVKKLSFLNRNNELVGEVTSDVMGVLVNVIHTDEDAGVVATFTLGEGKYGKPLPIRLEIGKRFVDEQKLSPTNVMLERKFLKMNNGRCLGCYMFRNFLFEVIIEEDNEENEAKAILLIKKHVFSEDAKWKKLNEEVQLMEKLLTQRGNYARTAIPEAVKLFVFTRDEGKCVRCGSVHKLHFDHVIPVAKGGGNSIDNIQISCEQCNLKKSDKITF